jgi:hypothetical protein
VGSEDLSGFALWHGVFRDICDLLVASAGVTNEEIATYMVQLVSENDYWPDPWWTMSAMSAEHAGALGRKIHELAVFLGGRITEYSPSIELARENMWVLAQNYYVDFNRVDLVSAMQNLGAFISDPFVQDKVAEILAAFDQTVIAEWHAASQLEAHGLSLYFPRLESSYYDSYHTSLLDFTDNFCWDEFLRSYYSGSPTAVADLYVGDHLVVTTTPNPFQASTQISFQNRNEGVVTLQVFDLVGRLVDTLCAGPVTAGPVSFNWDGRDHRGRPVPTGIYYFRLEANRYVKTQRMTVVR